MGIDIDRDRFRPDEYVRFAERLEVCLDVLASLLARPGFGAGESSIGAELEVALIDRDAHPLPLNVEVLEETIDPRMTVELDRFNLECNLRHCALAGTPFGKLRREFEEAHAELVRAAARHGGRIAMIGILPTVRLCDLGNRAMTDIARYRALAYALRASRHAPFQLRIDGQDPLDMQCEDVTFEGAATSLQVHLRIDPGDFADRFNAIQATTAPLLALAVNSPIFLGHRLWAETRVALFKQAVDERDALAKQRRRIPRVGFGTGWLRRGAFELFHEAVHTFDPLLPVLDDEDPRARLEAGGVPRLQEIRLHQGTVWSWNRPVYDPADGGHLRIELRTLPSGPTIVDMLANIAFAVGLAYGLAPEIEALTRKLDFEGAHTNFYRAAQSGLDADFEWPDGAVGVSAPGDRVPARELAAALVDVARTGLRDQGVASDDSDPLLDVIAQRVRSGQTGASWQRHMLEIYEVDHPRERALERVVERYVALSSAGIPVHEWPLDPGGGAPS